MVFSVGKGLRGCNYNTFTSMDTQGVEVLHVANGDAVVEAVANYLILHLLPSP